jgi:hypothetical protein
MTSNVKRRKNDNQQFSGQQEVDQLISDEVGGTRMSTLQIAIGEFKSRQTKLQEIVTTFQKKEKSVDDILVNNFIDKLTAEMNEFETNKLYTILSQSNIEIFNET